MTTKKGEQFRKHVDFVAKDDEEQVATGIVMVPDKVDLQGDFVTPETVQSFADQFATFMEAGEADGGVMHAVWPSDHKSLERNEVLEEATEIGGKTVPAGAWVQSWKAHDPELWSLISDGILEGYSIGAVDASWSAPMGQDDLPDGIEVAADYPEDQPVWELLSGIIREVSDVDIPAVPDAMILDTKSADKRLGDYLGDPEGFIEEAVQRGHEEGEAERLWEYLQRAVSEDGAGEPGKQSMFHKAGKAFLSALTGSDDAEASKTADSAEKESRTLSQANRERLMAAHDAVEDALRSDVDFQTNRFTDNPAVDFDVADYGKSVDDVEADGTPDGGKDAAADMTNDNETEDAPEWAKTIIEQTEENTKRIEELVDGEKDGAGEEPPEEDSGKDAGEETPEWAKSLEEAIEKNAETIEEVAKASGSSHQLGAANNSGGEVEREYSADWDKTLGLSGDAR